MYLSMTEESENYFFDLLEADMNTIQQEISTIPSDTSALMWREKLTKLTRNYSLSSRFALMRILCGRAGGSDSFEAAANGALCTFGDISMEHAEALTPQEHLQYMACLLDMAGLQADSDPETDLAVISRAWYDEESACETAEYLLPPQIRSDEKKLKKARTAIARENKAKFKTRLTREEAFQLGHMLRFTLTEMKWYLLRVFDVADGFRSNHSDDLIEAYGFLANASWKRVSLLKEQFAAASAGITKVGSADEESRWTRDMSATLMGRVQSWSHQPETMDRQFLAWLLAKAPRLDVPSRTACRIYRNLAAYAYTLVESPERVPEEEEFADCIQDIYDTGDLSEEARKLLYQDGTLSYALCKKAADVLLLHNKISSASIQADNAKAWHVLTTRSDGAPTAAGGVVNSSRSRVADILAGKIQAEKGDMLYLLWFTANLIWQSADMPDQNDLCCRILDFMDTANYLLDAALLPKFYPPHIMEQSMLLSIVCGGLSQDDPSVVYEYILNSLTVSRKRESGSSRHDPDFKVQVVTHYRSHPELSLEDCAKQFDISPQTLSAWQKKLIDDGIIRA